MMHRHIILERKDLIVAQFRLFSALLIALLSIYWATTYRNDAHAQNGEKWALLVGINDYEDKRIVDLDYANADVTAFRNVLIDPNVGGFSKAHVYLMTDKNTGDLRPTHTNVLFRLGKLAELIKPEDTFIFYFSGHGLTRGEQSFLLTVNADGRELETLELTAIPLERLQRYMRRIRARRVLFILDACRNDPERGKGGSDNLLTETFAKGVRVVPREGKDELPQTGATFFACSLGERAYEWLERKQSVFSYYLIEGFKGKAKDADGNVTLVSLEDYVRQRVIKWSKENLPKGKKQTPWLKLEGTPKMVLTVHKTKPEEISTTAALVISTKPSGASVYVDKGFRGRTPLKLEIDTGARGERTVEVGLELKGYKSRAARIKLNRGRTERWTDVKLSKVKLVTSTPPTITGKDGAKMVLIPAGEFQMGSNDGEDNEKPVHTVYLNAFYMDKYEVTNSQYAQFLNDYGKNADAVGHELIDLDDEDCLIEKGGSVYRPKSGYENHPVIEVTWYGAAAYAQFYGKRLPTEAEWEKAARGGLVGKKYPWGDSISPTKANYDSDRSRSYSTADMLEYLNPVGSFPPNGYGLYDMAGNVWEWCADEYDKNYYSKSPKDNPTGPGTPILFVNSGFTSVKERRVCRGGSWVGNPDYMRCADRYWGDPAFSFDYQGFRCVVSSPSIPQ